MNRDSIYQRADHSRGSVDIDILKSSSSAKKRKNGGFRVIVRKLFGRKSVKSQISLPTPTRNLEYDPSAFITTARAVSLPVRGISQRSALGSHAPFEHAFCPEGTDATPDDTEPRYGRPRGTSLPSLDINPPDPMLPRATEGANEELSPREIQTVEDGPIGFAITSGSHPKRRSRSADAYYDAARGHRMSPIQWRQWRRRSDEIRFWRDSIAESPVLASKNEDRDTTAVEEAPKDTANAIDEVPDVNKDNRGTFDFGVLATSMHEREAVSMEDRMVTLEVKLMDLEYAISKIQAQPPSPAGPSPRHLRPDLQSRNPSSGSGHSGTSSPLKSMEQSRASVVESESVEPTSRSSNGFRQDRKVRPLSDSPTIRPPTAPPLGVSEHGATKSRNRNSITSLTIDHYTTLITLIRREQAARIRLEDQVSDLQRQLMNIQYPSPPQSRSRIPRWKGSPYNVTRSEVMPVRSGRSVFEDDDSDTEDGDEDIYETPTERREFEGAVFGGPFDGEAF
ncbi:hypothetical protein MMC30_008320 [Trapelia coarctata]|nr:hypothetical protein [Trapelia coarctata]